MQVKPKVTWQELTESSVRDDSSGRAVYSRQRSVAIVLCERNLAGCLGARAVATGWRRHGKRSSARYQHRLRHRALRDIQCSA